MSSRPHCSAAEQKWAAKGFDNYSVDMVYGCGECPPGAHQLARVEVVGGAVSRVVILGTGEVIDGDERLFWTTVESLFAWIRQANEASGLKRLVFTVDDQLGFPTYIESSYGSDVQDGGGAITLSNVAPLAP